MYKLESKNENYVETYAFIEYLFSREECEMIVNQCLGLEVMKAATFDDKQTDSIRKNNVSWLDPQNESLQWIYKRCLEAIKTSNTEVFNYDLTWGEDFQFTIYDQMEDHYIRHVDSSINGDAATRKLTFSVQLSDPEFYEGSRLLLHTKHEPIEAKLEQGTMNLFPSYVLHEVTPLTSGKRYALVGWIHGPKFR
jgi:PKHD-type hydroxylase